MSINSEIPAADVWFMSITIQGETFSERFVGD